MKSTRYYCILDIGGTKILSLLVNDKGTVIFREKTPTPEEDSEEILLDQINNIINRASLQLPGDYKLNGIGICIAAFVNYHNGLIYGSPNLPVKKNTPLGNILAEKWNLPVIIENDGNAAVLGEVSYGAAKGVNNAIYITVSTGIGGGLFLEGRLLRGQNGLAGEIGHTKVDNSSNLICGCGKKGCLESLASGESISKRAQKFYEEHGTTTSNVFTRAHKGDKIAAEIIEESLQNLGVALANLISLLNPEVIVIGGGVSNEGETFFSKLESYIEKNISVPLPEKIKLRKAKLEPESGVWGVFSLL